MSFGLFMDGDFSEQTGKLITFIVTMISMAAGFTLIPLLPSPLPIVVAFLVAYSIYKDMPYGAMSGSLIIVLGLFYHLSRIGFFQLIESPLRNTILMALMIAPFVICPVIANNNLQIIAMDMGIIAVSLLFFRSTFYLAIPLILVFATIYKGKGIAYTFIYYAAISIPLQVMQFLKTYEVEMMPPLYTPLDTIYSDIQASLPTISLETLKKVFNTITGITPSEIIFNGERLAFESFINSLPGMVFFFIIMSGLISAIAILNMNMPDPIKKANMPGMYVDAMVYVLPIFAAALTNIVFFVAIDYLQAPLAFQAMVDRPILISSTTFTILFSAPVALAKYVGDLKEVREKRSDALITETDALIELIVGYREIAESMGNPTPDNFMDIVSRMNIVEDELREINRSAKTTVLELDDIDMRIRRIYNELREEALSFETQLDVALRDHYIKIKFEYLEAAGEIKELGLEVDAPEVPDLAVDAPLEEKVEHIKNIVKFGRILVERLIETSDKIYEIISSLFEPNLPRDSATLQISRQKQDEDEPWVIIKAILVSLKNWEKQYSADIVNATRPINDSVETIVTLSKRKSSLLPLLGDKFELIQSLSEKVSKRDFTEGDENLKVLKVILIRDTILSTVTVVGRIIGLLYYHLQDLEFNINLLLPREDYEWNRNITLTERMNHSLEVINNYEKYGIDEIINHLYRVLSYIDEAVDTIEYYNERKEMLLNYPVFSKKISRILDLKEEVKLDELGVAENYGREYLKMYQRTTYSPLTLEETTNSLRRNPDA
ncbi:MAG: hypothetical protein NWE89_08875 [Candidatus Bathyarchaeota archaeon]|nr:hypothetical protein [Candidatus Bathyarchaeota archaeon]